MAVFWLVLLVIVFALLHLALFVPMPIAIVAALVVMAVLWIVWKLKWVILAVIGLEELFGGRPNNDA